MIERDRDISTDASWKSIFIVGTIKSISFGETELNN